MTAGKVVTIPEAVTWRDGITGPVVFTNGVFDLLHRGHIDYLEAARALGNGPSSRSMTTPRPAR